MNNNITYVREKMLSFPAVGLRLKGIPVLVSAQLSFYQKYVILLLRKGIRANSIEELENDISEILNVSLKCVREFIEYLDAQGYLVYSNDGFYSLKETLHTAMSPTMKDIMVADTEVRDADCDNILYVEDADMLFLESDFDKTLYSIKNNGIRNDPSHGRLIAAAISNKTSVIRNLITRNYEGTNIHLKSDFTFEIRDTEFYSYQFNFPALIQYSYSTEDNKATREITKVPSDIKLPAEFVEQLSKKYNIDEKLPRFIELSDSFYKKVSPSATSINDCETSIEHTGVEIPPLQQEVKNRKSTLANARRERTKVKKNQRDELARFQKELESANETIAMNETIILNSSESENKDLIANLKADNEATKNEAARLSEIISQKESELKASENAFIEREALLSEKVSESEKLLALKTAQLSQYEKELKRLTNEYEQLIQANKSKVHPIINSVLVKYSVDDNVISREVCDICSQIDCAISASEANSFDEVRRSLANVRNRYRQMLKVTFDTLLSKELQNLGGYFTDPFTLIKLEDLFRIRKIDLDIKNKMIIFHSLINAFGHMTDNGPKKKENEKRIADFKMLSTRDRENILLCVPRFFNEITLSKSEMKKIIEKLKV